MPQPIGQVKGKLHFFYFSNSAPRALGWACKWRANFPKRTPSAGNPAYPVVAAYSPVWGAGSGAPGVTASNGNSR